jgi:hypothetical protein
VAIGSEFGKGSTAPALRIVRVTADAKDLQFVGSVFLRIGSKYG